MFGRKKKEKSRSAPKASTHNLDQFVVEEIELKAVPSSGPAPKRGAPRWWRTAKYIFQWLGLWLMLTLAAIAARSAWPFDETTLTGIAWEMWTTKNFLVPTLNGVPQAQLPLYFWLVQLGWRVFEVNDWWPRLLPALFALASVFTMWRVVRLLWPKQAELALEAPLLLLGTLAAALTIGFTAIDWLRVFFVLLGWWALLVHYRSRDMRAWFLLAVSFTGGWLAAGPLTLLYVWLPALLAPLWIVEAPKPVWKHWYRDLANATLVAAVLTGVWLLLAMRLTSVGYAKSFFTLPALLPTLDLFPLARPWWWHALLLWLLLLPWSVWPLLAMRLWHSRGEPANSGMRFCLFASAPALIALSLLEPRQPQFLLPLVPAGVAACAWLLFEEKLKAHGEDSMAAGMTLPLVAIGAALAIIPKLPRMPFLPELLWEQSPFLGVGIIGIGVAVGFLPARNAARRARDYVLGSVALVVLFSLTFVTQFEPANDLRATAQAIAQQQAAGRPVAVVGNYRGEFHFSGRLTGALETVAPAQALEWAAAHEQGVLVSYSDTWQPAVPGVRALLSAPFRDTSVNLWDAGTLIAKIP